MSALSEFLYRVRRLGVPGAPHSTSPPIDRIALAEAELAPVFAALDAHILRAQNVRDTASSTAARRQQEAAEQAQAYRDSADGRAIEVRSATLAAHLAELEAEAARVAADAERDANAMAAAMASESGMLVERIVQRALSILATATNDSSAPS